jgi:adenylate kinase family enzyme
MSTAYLFFGKSGSGKGTQAQILKTQLESTGRNVIYIETGKLFRDFTATHQDYMGDHIRSVIDAGKLMPAFFPIYLWSRELIEHFTGNEDIIMDGVSRRIEEAPMIDSALDFFNIEKRFVVNIDVSDEWVFDHMGARSDRADDTDEGMKKRLAWFTTEVVPVINYFKNNEKYTSLTINGEQTIEEVNAEIQIKIG